MTRTTQTCKKTTGGPAKRGMLPRFKKFAGHAGTEVIKTVQSKAALPSGQKIILKPLCHNIFCVFCWDGGSLYECSICPRAVCAKCVAVPAEFEERIKDPDVHFICPGCHEMRGKGSRSDAMKPYFGFEDCGGTPVLAVPATIHGHIEMASRSQISSNPILVLHFVLTTLDPVGSPAAMMQHKLRPYRPKDSLQFHEIIFDIGTDEKADRHAESMKTLVDRLKLLEYERVEVFIYTHSETVRGDIWGGFAADEFAGRGKHRITISGDPVAYTVDDFFAGLFVGGIEDYVRGATLWMLICGHTVRMPNSFKMLKTCVKQYEVEHVFAFDATLFHACLTISLVIVYVRRVLVEGFEVQEVMHDLLQACPRLAMHSSIIHLHNPTAFRRRQPTMVEYHEGVKRAPTATASMTVSTYTFFHDSNRPFGNALPYQCSNCKCVRSWKHITSKHIALNESKFTCRSCGHTITYTKPEQSKIVLYSQGQNGQHTPRSGWLMSLTAEPRAPVDV
ncbi:hypothetical protein EV702DRAFT_1202713 [Suillus placidus]|uniref:Uncharacterized protein n=1 Tax=Suillus placidus TaxID=48579 RepID=A0A9P7CX07_9AGAM|nr:hypothetical protein EV702DRAFT_1202713 [Suillus placidus]